MGEAPDRLDDRSGDCRGLRHGGVAVRLAPPGYPFEVIAQPQLASIGYRSCRRRQSPGRRDTPRVSQTPTTGSRPAREALSAAPIALLGGGTEQQSRLPVCDPLTGSRDLTLNVGLGRLSWPCCRSGRRRQARLPSNGHPPWGGRAPLEIRDSRHNLLDAAARLVAVALPPVACHFRLAAGHPLIVSRPAVTWRPLSCADDSTPCRMLHSVQPPAAGPPPSLAGARHLRLFFPRCQ